jgi:hypothetical protein
VSSGDDDLANHARRVTPSATLVPIRCVSEKGQPMKILKAKGLAMLMLCMCLVPPITAQERDSDILSKADARLLFSVSRQQWEDNIRGAVAAGLARKIHER